MVDQKLVLEPPGGRPATAAPAAPKPLAEDRSAAAPTYGALAGLLPAAGAKGRWSDDLMFPASEKHQPFLDLTRIGCVFLVMVDHGNYRFGVWNVGFCQEWVLQYLYLVCGVCYGLSARNLGSYLSRLGGYVAIGIFVNWSAWVLTKKDWQHSLFDVVFHFWFVIGIMGYVVLLHPVKSYLHRVRDESPALGGGGPHQDPADQVENPAEAVTDSEAAERRYRESLPKSLVCMGGGVIGLILVFMMVVEPCLTHFSPAIVRAFASLGGNGPQFWGLPSTAEEAEGFIQRLCSYCLLTTTNLWLLFTSPWVFRRTSLVTWALVCNTYGQRMVFYRGADERPFHGFDLMTLGLVCYYFGLTYRKTIGEYIVRYWFACLFVVCLIWPMGHAGRFDENPPLDRSMRARVNLLEGMFALAWLAAGERLLPREIFTQDRLDFMNDWALLVFLIHKAVHIVMPPPWNWLFLASLAPLCYLRRRGA